MTQIQNSKLKNMSFDPSILEHINLRFFYSIGYQFIFFFCQRKQHNHHEIESIPPLQQPFTPSNSLHHQMWNLSQLCKRVFSTNQRERENNTYYAPLPQSQSPGIFQSIEESITANNTSTWSPQEPTQIGRERITNIMHSNSMYLRST